MHTGSMVMEQRADMVRRGISTPHGEPTGPFYVAELLARWRDAYDNQLERERQKDREIEKLQREVATLFVVVAQCREAAEREALQELLLGYPPAEHTALVFAPAGTVLEKGSWLIVRRTP